MKYVTVLEHENAATFGNHINALAHIPRIECRRATFEWFLAILAFGIVEVQVKSVVGSLGAVRRFVGAVAVR